VGRIPRALLHESLSKVGVEDITIGEGTARERMLLLSELNAVGIGQWNTMGILLGPRLKYQEREG